MALRAVLCSLDARFNHVSLPLLYLRRAVERAGWECRLLHLTVNQDYLELLGAVVKAQPDLVGIPVYIWNSECAVRLISDLKQLLPGVTVVAGGPEAGGDPERWLQRSPQSDTVVSGPGEGVFEQLLRIHAEEQGTLPRRITAEPLAVFNSPYRSSDRPLVEGKLAYIETSRGCPFRCSYCFSSRQQQPLIVKSSEQALQELLFLAKLQPQVVKLVDRTFNADRRHARAVWRGLLAARPQCRFHFEIHPALLEEEDFALLEEVPDGLFQFEIGVQTIDPHTRRLINRSGSWEVEERNLRRLSRLRSIPLHLDLICGLPEESFDVIGNGFDRLLALRPDHLQPGFLKLLPGTQMKEQAGEFGLIAGTAPPYQVLQTAALSFFELELLQQCESVLECVFNSGRFSWTVAWLHAAGVPLFALCCRAARLAFPAYPRGIKDFTVWAGILLEAAGDSGRPAGGVADALRLDYALQSRSRELPALLDISASGRQADRRLGAKLLTANKAASAKEANSGIVIEFADSGFRRYFDLPDRIFLLRKEPVLFADLEQQTVHRLADFER